MQLIPYDPDVLDESVLWTESRDLGDTFRAIRMVNNIRLNVDAFNGDKNHGGVRDGTPIVLWEWKKGDNQRWKIVPYCKSLSLSLQTYSGAYVAALCISYRRCWNILLLFQICRRTHCIHKFPLLN